MGARTRSWNGKMRKRRTAEMQIREIMKSLFFCTVGFSYLDISSSFVFAVAMVQCWLKLASFPSNTFILTLVFCTLYFLLIFYLIQVRSLLCLVIPSVTPRFEFCLNCWICIELIHGFFLVVEFITNIDLTNGNERELLDNNLANPCINLEKSMYQFWQIHLRI